MRKLAVFALAFAAGIFLAQYALPGDWLLPAAFVCLGGACLSLLLPWRLRRRVLPAGVALALALGYNWLYIRQVQQPLEALAGTEHSAAVMTVCSEPAATDYGARVTVRLEGYPHGKVTYYGTEALLDLDPGQTITADVQFQSAARIRDSELTTFTSRGVFLLAYSRGDETFGPGTSGSWRWLPLLAGRAMNDTICRIFDGDTAAFLQAMLIGRSGNLSVQAETDLRQAGLSHILAVSGMHCSFLVSLLSLFALGQKRRLALWGIPILIFYALLTGASPSVVRSCIMAIFVLSAPLLRRDSDPITSLSAALLVILLQNPFAAASISLQLSFSSVAGLLLVSPRLYQTLLGSKTRGRVYRFLAASFSATIGALVFTTPLTAAYFNMLVLIAPVSNLLCLYAAAGAFISGIVSVGLGMASSALGSLLGLAPQALVWYILKAVHLLSQIPGHAVYFSNPYLKYWLLYVYLLFSAAWLIRSGGRRKYALAAGLAAGTLVLTLRAGALRYGDGTLDVQVLDVGQGQCVLVYSGGSCTLVDCGSANSWYDPGTIAADTLYSMGCGRLEHLVLTHYDTDHISGVETLLSRIDVETLVVPGLPDSAAGNALLEAAREQGTQVQILREETVWDLGASTLTVYPPLGDGESNEAGLSILCSSGDFDLLITGDMDSNTEEQLLTTYDLPDLEALVVGHHGSKYSTSEALLSTLTPELAFISVGDNSYGHPSDQALWRLVQAGAAIYRTDLQGTIHLTVN